MNFVCSLKKDSILLSYPRAIDRPTTQHYCRFHPGILLCYNGGNVLKIQNNKRFLPGYRHFEPFSLPLFVYLFYRAICRLPFALAKSKRVEVRMKKRLSEDGFFDRACRVTVSYRTFARLIYFRKTPKKKSRL